MKMITSIVALQFANSFFLQLHNGCSETKSLNPPFIIKRRLMQEHEMAFQFELMNIK
jgi:hypothetical protein